MNTPVITLDAPPHNEIIHHEKNGWLLSCFIKKDDNPENPFSIIEQTQINQNDVICEIKKILLDINGINNVIKNTKNYTEKINSFDKFKNNILNSLS